MTLGQQQEAFAADFARLIIYAIGRGYGVRIGEVWRPPEMQQIYVATGRSWTMNSRHGDKCAGDLHFTKDGKLCYPEELGRYWESLHPLNKAGMFWNNKKDGPHFERRVK